MKLKLVITFIVVVLTSGVLAYRPYHCDTCAQVIESDAYRIDVTVDVRNTDCFSIDCFDHYDFCSDLCYADWLMTEWLKLELKKSGLER